MATAIQPTERKVSALDRVRAYAEMDEVKKRFINLLGKEEGQAYIESIVIAVSRDDRLQQCTPKSIMISAMRAASLKLSVDPILEQAHLVAYGKEAQIIPDYHGLVQMSVNTNYYRYAPETSAVYVGEEVNVNRFTGEVTITGKPTEPLTTKGWVSYYEAKNGIKRWLYMTNEECDTHAETYNPGGYNSKDSPWNNKGGANRDKMRRKTCLRIFVKKYGNFSPVMQKYLATSEAPIDVQVEDLPDDSNLDVKAAPHFKQSASAGTSILMGEGNPDPVKENTWTEWTEWKERAGKVAYVLPSIDQATATDTDLRNYLAQIAPEITAAELDTDGGQGQLL
jgi:recombination protein RecT